MFWRISQIVAISIFIFSVIQLYREPNIGYLIVALSSFASLMTWLKGPVVLAGEKLNDPNMEVVNNSIERLKEINSLSSRWELNRTMKYHQNPIVSRKATIALAELDNKRAYKGIATHIAHPEVAVALSNMKEIKDKRVIELLFGILKNSIEAIETENWELVKTSKWNISLRAIVKCFGKIKDRSAVKSLIFLFGFTAHYYGYDKIEQEIINSLGEIGGSDAKELLIQLYKDEWVCPEQEKSIVFHRCAGGDRYKYDENVQIALKKILGDSDFEELASSIKYRDRLERSRRGSSLPAVPKRYNGS